MKEMLRGGNIQKNKYSRFMGGNELLPFKLDPVIGKEKNINS